MINTLSGVESASEMTIKCNKYCLKMTFTTNECVLIFSTDSAANTGWKENGIIQEER